MGMESFRVDFIYESTTQKEIVNYLETGFKIEKNYFTFRKLLTLKKMLIENEYKIEDYVIAYFDDSEMFLSLEACFSNFDKYILLCYNIYSFLKGKFDIKIKLRNNLIKENIDLPAFQKAIKDFYDLNYTDFLKKYIIKNTDMLPGKYFYKNYKKV